MFCTKAGVGRRCFTQTRKDAKRCRVSKGFSLRLCAFAPLRETSSSLIGPEHSRLTRLILNAPLPFVEGVGPSCQWLPAGPWKTVIDFFKEQYPHVHATTWKARMAKGQVMDETGR